MSYTKIPGSKKKLVITVDYNAFDEFVKIHLPRVAECPDIKKYEFAAYEEAQNDSAYSYDTLSLYDYHQEKPESFEHDLENFKNGKFHYMASAILHYLTFKGVIEPAEYIIKVSW